MILEFDILILQSGRTVTFTGDEITRDPQTNDLIIMKHGHEVNRVRGEYLRTRQVYP